MKEYQDYFFKKAKKEGVLSRAFFKLEEMDKKHRLLRAGCVVLDLGCSPGSWLQYAAKKVGASGKVIGVDKAALGGTLPPQVQFVLADIFAVDTELLVKASGKPFDLVLSDVAPATTGQRFVDQQNSLRLAERAIEIARKVLAPGGTLVLKIFQSNEAAALRDACKKSFENVSIEKPQSSRRESFEVYWVCSRFTSSR